MDVEMVTNEVINRIMEMLKQEQEISRGIDEKKFLKSGGEDIFIPGYHAVYLEDGSDINEVLSYDSFIIDKLSIEEMVSVANGNSINEKTKLLRQFILNGKSVYINEAGLEYRLYKAVSNPVYYNLFSEYEKKMQQYGINILSKVALEKELMNKYVQGKSNDKKCSQVNDQKMLEEDTFINYSTEKKLITNEVALQLAEESTVVLKLGTIITPFAKDVFKENNTEIQFV